MQQEEIKRYCTVDSSWGHEMDGRGSTWPGVTGLQTWMCDVRWHMDERYRVDAEVQQSRLSEVGSRCEWVLP